MRTLLAITVVTLTAWGWSMASFADGASQQEMKSLDEQVQTIKTDVLSIGSDLGLLEERLLFPSNTQVAVFVSLSNEQPFRLDAVQIRIDGELATHHIYSFKELDALKSGGVQRIFTGNFGTGDHQIEVSVVGKLESGQDYKQSQQFTFNKGVDPRLLGIALAAPGGSDGTIQLQDW